MVWGRTEFGKIFVQLGNTATNKGALLHQHDLFSGLGGFKGSSQAADPATNDQYGLVGCDYFRHG
jgi:hypothetical protein